MDPEDVTGQSSDGVGRSWQDLTTVRSPLMPPIEIYDGQLLTIERSLRSSVPAEVAKRVTVTRNIAVYGAFCYEFFAVSVYWSFTCVEMALDLKFREMNPNQRDPPGTLWPLLEWAGSKALLPPRLQTPTALAQLRNHLARPRKFSQVLTPAMALDAFALTVETVNRLWPLES